MTAPAGEDDTCVIRFIAGAPYEDVGFRIVDKEWDFSAKRERGFKSRFEGGVLQLWFQFKKVSGSSARLVATLGVACSVILTVLQIYYRK